MSFLFPNTFMLPPAVALACTYYQSTGNAIDLCRTSLTTKCMSEKVEVEMNQYCISHDHTMMQ